MITNCGIFCDLRHDYGEGFPFRRKIGTLLPRFIINFKG